MFWLRKLTLIQINLPMFSKLSVKLAAQVLSYSMVVGITTLVSLRTFPKSAMPTATFLE